MEDGYEIQVICSPNFLSLQRKHSPPGYGKWGTDLAGLRRLCI